MNHPSVIVFGIMLGMILSVSAMHMLALFNVGLWAFFAGLIGSGFVVSGSFLIYQKQRLDDNEKSLKQREDLLSAERAVLGIDLSELMHDLEDASAFLKEVKFRLSGPLSPSTTLSLPKIRIDRVERIKKLIVLCEQNEREQISDLLQSYQVAFARLEGLREYCDPTHPLYKSGYDSTVLINPIMEMLSLYVRLNRVFPFARHQQATIPPPPFSKKEVSSAAYFLGISSLVDNDTEETLIGTVILTPARRMANST